MAGLNEKQVRFAQEYVVDLCITQAAIRAGYSEKTAGQIGFKLFKNAEIQANIQKALQKRAERTEIRQDRVIQEIARLAFSDLRKVMGENGELLQPHEWDDDTAAAISSLEVNKQAGGDVRSTEQVNKQAGGDVRSAEQVVKIKTWDKNSALEKLARHLGLYAPEQHEHKVEAHVSPSEKLKAKLDGIKKRS